ncbi:hypothetical protein [Pleionea sp. CnH1-48]|uniref:VPS10 domain-containing protein n=1 Tax=Pleionea sp. CnH1-48 TaxID=2954494 RepID=UPI002097EC20|nr:hypothetical protein [Pleionea sp. CnH1-48]MCO7224960.1 hypothetical protein [Pleionea sp. CnH1-48]
MKKLSLYFLSAAISFGSCMTYAKEENDANIYSSLKFRNIGPAVTGGRIGEFAFNPENPAEYYAAVASGGVWKTSNAGVTWTPVFDNEASYSIGTVSIAPDNPSVVWVGTGENNSQRSVGYGDGVYKSIDAGKSWKNVGLKNSEHIGKVLIDPRDNDVVYVAAQGPLWNKGGDRGLYKTTDGGKKWNKVLDISEHTGVSDVVFDPDTPDTLYAVAYQRRRHVWTLINGGPESSLYKSTDAGKTWRKINKGLPSVELGRIGIAVAPSKPDTIYAVVEAADGKSGFYRSTNKGESWHKQSGYVSGSPQYYQELVVDPNDHNRVYSLDTYLMVTKDGGKNFKKAGEKHKHVDNHALWIDPNNSRHLIVGSDGGIYESWDQAANWSFKDNMSITQFYKVAVDNDYPFYNVYGGTQDNATLGAPHRTSHTSGIRNRDWLYTQFGDGFKPAIDPTNADIIYSQYQYGGLSRYDRKSGERVQIQPVSPDANEAQRFNWNSPLLISPHNHKRLYYASQRVFRSDDQGDSWQAISPDLSRNLDRNKLKVMDRVWGVDTVAKNKSTSFYGSVVSLTESPLVEGLLFAGTDDGLIQVSANDGKKWTQADWPSKVPDNSYVSDLEASLFNDKVVFATFDNHKKGDFKPYVFRSDNRGESWTNITNNLPKRGTVYAIAQDHKNENLLFVGTEFGVFFSQNGGEQWVQLKSGIPTIAVRDIEIQRRESDLVLATFGRGFYVLDNYGPLRESASKVKKSPATLFPVRKAYQFIEFSPLGLPGKSMRGSDYYMAENPEYGATFFYYLKEDFKSLKAQRQAKEKALIKKGKDVFYPSWDALKKEDFEEAAHIVLTVTDADGHLVRRIKKPAKQGFQQVNWDLRYPGFSPIKVDGKNNSGPLVVPGKYQVSIAKWVNGVETDYQQSQTFEVTAIDNRTFPSQQRTQDLAFDMKAGQLAKAISGAGKYIKELESRIAHAEAAIVETLTAEQSLKQSLSQTKQQLKEVKLKLNGNSVVSKRAEPVPTSVSGYISYLRWSRNESTTSVSGLQKLRLERANNGYQEVYNALVDISKSIQAVENKLLEKGTNWLPGTLPAKPLK